MKGKTHLAFGFALMFFFFPHVNNKLVFVPIVLIASLLPDIDSAYSYLGNKMIFRPLQFFVKHRGVIHSLTLAVVLSGIFAFVYPPLAFPFFLGYAGHLFLDTLTIEGIKPFWPFKAEVKGHFRSGGSIDSGVYIGLIIASVLLFIRLFF